MKCAKNTIDTVEGISIKETYLVLTNAKYTLALLKKMKKRINKNE